MGKPFLEELSQIESTFQWACEIDSKALNNFPTNLRESLICVGSGGSQSAAVMAAQLHRQLGGTAYATTPLDLIETCRQSSPGQVLFLSASGRNKDILAACRSAVESESRKIHGLCLATNSPLSAVIEEFSRGSMTQFNLPSGKDGFLATNSLIASFVILTQQYRAFCPLLFPDIKTVDCTRPKLPPNIEVTAQREEWLVLYGGWAWPAAQDLESKMSEAALKTVQLTDLRNFGHGRHHWLAKRPRTSGVVFMVDSRYQTLAEHTAAALPNDIPITILNSQFADARASFELLLQGFELTRLVGDLKGIDPGRPGVPPFGRKLYHLSIPRGVLQRSSRSKETVIRAADARKAGRSPIDDSIGNNEKGAASAAVAIIGRTDIASVVLDYDGTLVDPIERFGSIRPVMAAQLVRILEAGFPIGVATGRGKSVRNHLHDAIPEPLRHMVLVGYYNGGEILALNGEELPSNEPIPKGSLESFFRMIQSDGVLEGLADIEPRPSQITVSPKRNFDWAITRQRLYELLATQRIEKVKVHESTHSIDVLPSDVSKVTVVDAVKDLASRSGKTGDVLRIGDCGAWPGNDCEMLAHKLGLSVDVVSTSPDSCWNLLPPGVSGVSGTIHYLSLLAISKDSMRLKL